MDLPEINFTKFVLDNGLTVIAHEDNKAPVVAVSIWYHVGSSYEPSGKTGFAHLFEHLMFSGSEHHRGSFSEPFELVGTTDQNGTTWFDRTNYFQTVPTTALDMALWMESDRMGHLLGAIGQHELETQRGVVKNEKLQNENQPYGRLWEELQAHAFPANHPYRHITIGSIADIDAATLEDVQTWFKTYYGAANVVLVLAGNLTPDEARQKAQTYFGDIPSGPPVARPAPWTAERSSSTRSVQQDRVPMSRVMREWNVPGLGHDDLPLLEVAAQVLGGGTTSRLHQRLVHSDQLATSVSVFLQGLELASMFIVRVDVRPGVALEAVEAAIADEWEKFLRDGPDEDELSRARTSMVSGFVRGLERVGGFTGKALVLAEGEVYRGNPAAYQHDLLRLQQATPSSVRAAAQRWLARGDHTLSIVPAGSVESGNKPAETSGLPRSENRPPERTSPARAYSTDANLVDRSLGAPQVDAFPDLSFPAVQRAQLSNGIRVVLAERHAIPVTQVRMQFDAGLAADQGENSGIARMALAMLEDGSTATDTAEVAKIQQRLGAVIQPFTSLDSSGLALSVLNSGLEGALKLSAELIREPAYRDEDLARRRQHALAQVQREVSDPSAVASRVVPRLIYGKGHPYGVARSGTGSERALRQMTTDDLKAFHRQWVRPEKASVFVVGDTTLAELLPLLEQAFGDWTASDTMPTKALGAVDEASGSRIHLLHRPGAQAQIVVARPVASSTAENYEAMQLANMLFGGIFSSRLNMNLREDKRWTYGARSGAQDALGTRMMVVSTAVQVDKTIEAMREVFAELLAIVGDRPPTMDELDKVKAQTIRSLPSTYETSDAVLQTLVGNALYGRPDDYAQSLKKRFEAITLADVAAAAAEMFAPQGLTWLVVGDLSLIEDAVRDLGLGTVQVLKAEEIE